MSSTKPMNSTASNTRKRNKKSKVEIESESDVEEIPRGPTFYEQIEAQHASATGQNIDIKKIRIPLGKKLDQNELIEDFTIEEMDMPRTGTAKSQEDDDEPVIGDALQAAFFTVPLIILLIGLDIVVYIQYQDEISYNEVVARALKSVLPIWLLVYITHPRSNLRIVQFAFFAAAVICGCNMVHSVNVYGYYKVMQRAPALGTIMIWSVIEMELLPALATCAAIGTYTWYNGFSLL